MSSWASTSQRAVLLPHLADLWTDHVDSALRRANAIVPGIRRRLHDEMTDPVLEVAAPAREWDAERSLAAEVPF